MKSRRALLTYSLGAVLLCGGFETSRIACADPTTAEVAEDAVPVTPLARAHAHNDYLHRRPLLDALDQGFCSVEADVFLVDGDLLVAHTRFGLWQKETLRALYLDPLSHRVKENNGRVYADGTVFTLLIDIKRDGAAAYKVLDKMLAEYPDVFSVVKNGEYTEKAITVVISGSRPVASIEADTERYAGIDGRLSDLDSDKPVHLLPLISDQWSSHFKWRGRDEMPAEEKEKLTAIVKKVHDKGRRLRFWGIPDRPLVWKTLREAGVDMINTDNLSGLSQMLREPTE